MKKIMLLLILFGCLSLEASQPSSFATGLAYTGAAVGVAGTWLAYKAFYAKPYADKCPEPRSDTAAIDADLRAVATTRSTWQSIWVAHLYEENPAQAIRSRIPELRRNLSGFVDGKVMFSRVNTLSEHTQNDSCKNCNGPLSGIIAAVDASGKNSWVRSRGTGLGFSSPCPIISELDTTITSFLNDEKSMFEAEKKAPAEREAAKASLKKIGVSFATLALASLAYLGWGYSKK